MIIKGSTAKVLCIVQVDVFKDTTWFHMPDFLIQIPHCVCTPQMKFMLCWL